MKKCEKCGNTFSEELIACPTCNKNNNKKIVILTIAFTIVIAIISIIIAVILYNKKIEQEKYNNLPIKVDISMTSYYGNIDYILYELGLDLDLVTMGANCYTGV